MELADAHNSKINYLYSNLYSIENPENFFFSGEVIFGGQNPKNPKKNSKNFIVPNHSLGHTGLVFYATNSYITKL